MDDEDPELPERPGRSTPEDKGPSSQSKDKAPAVEEEEEEEVIEIDGSRCPICLDPFTDESHLNLCFRKWRFFALSQCGS